MFILQYQNVGESFVRVIFLNGAKTMEEAMEKAEEIRKKAELPKNAFSQFSIYKIGKDLEYRG